MMRRAISCIIIIMLLTLLCNSINAYSTIKKNSQVNNLETLSNCYISINGSLETQWKICFLKPFGDYRSTVLYWHLELQSDTIITISNEKDGDILYQNQGAIELKILNFRGIYKPSRPDETSPLNMFIDGKVTLINIEETNTNNENKKSNYDVQLGKESFTNCYIQINGKIHNDWPAIIKLPNMLLVGWIQDSDNNVLFGSYSYILLENDASIKVFSEKNGEILWQHQGSSDPLITLIGYKGLYEYFNPENELSQVNIEGDCLYSSIRLGNYGT